MQPRRTPTTRITGSFSAIASRRTPQRWRDALAAAAKALAATDEKESNEYLKQAAKAVSEDAPADWLFGYRVTVAVDKHVQGFPSKLSQTVLPLWRISKNK